MKIALCVAFLLSSAIAAEIKINPLSDDFINYINSQQNSWKAGKNFDENTPLSEIRRKLGLLKKDANQIKAKHDLNVNDDDDDIPETFDSREHWPQCADVIGTIPDQSNCGSCWAVAAASAMSDRRCIASNGDLKVPVSAEDLLSCCKSCGFGCNGGYIRLAWSYWATTGIVTGGLYNSSIGCKPYSMQSCDHHVEGSKISCDDIPSYDTPSCTKKCSTEDFVYQTDLTKGKTVKYDFYNMQDIQKDILQYGPIEAGFDVYDDFLVYKSGIYHHVAGDYQGGHAVRIIGWGTENDTPYWLIANSWNEDWGDKGLFKIRRGSNECGIEDDLGSGEAVV